MGLFAEFVEGPLLWVAWIVFIGGSILRLIAFFSLSRKRDKIIYQHFHWGYVLKTWLRFLLPFNQTVKKSPVFTLSGYVFHVCLILVPLFIVEHIMYWEEETRFGWSWYSLALPERWAYWMTLAVIFIGAFFLVRRIVAPEVRIISSASDYLLLIVAILPFLTGWLSVNVQGSAFLEAINIRLIHIMSGELMLFLIPLTKLSHFVMFFPSRMVIGIEWGRRGYSA